MLLVSSNKHIHALPQSTSNINMSVWEKRIRVISSIGVYLLQKVMSSLILPIIAQYDWAVWQVKNSETSQTQNSTTNFSINSTDDLLKLTDCDIFGNCSSNTTNEVTPTVLVPSNYSPETGTEETVTRIDFRLTIVFLAQSIVSLVVSPAAGALGDHLGFDTPLVAALVISIIISSLYTVSSSFTAVLVAKTLQGIASSCAQPNVLGRMFVIYPRESREGKMLLGVVMATSCFSFFMPAVCGILYQYFGQLVAFLSLVPVEVFLLISVVATFRFGKHSLKHQTSGPITSNSGKEAVSTNSNKSKSVTHDEITHQVQFLKVLTNRKVLITSGVLAVAWFPKICFEETLSIWVEHQFAGDTTTTSLVWGMAGFAILASILISTKYDKKYPQHICRYTAIHLVLSAIPITILPIMPDPLTAAVCFSFLVYFASSARYGAMSILSRLAEREFQGAFGRVMGVATIGIAIPHLVAPLVTVPLFNRVGFGTMCMLIGPISILYSPFLCFLRNTKGNRVNDSSASHKVVRVVVPSVSIQIASQDVLQQNIPQDVSLQDAPQNSAVTSLANRGIFVSEANSHIGDSINEEVDVCDLEEIQIKVV